MVILFVVMLAPPLFLLYNVLRYTQGAGSRWQNLKKHLLNEQMITIPLVLITVSILLWLSL
jgi:hypothetical protein